MGANSKKAQLQTKLKQLYTEWLQTLDQIKVQHALVENYSTLQKAEQLRFQNGESSLFLVNAREQKTLEGAQKLVEVKAKNFKSIAGLKWAAGLLWDDGQKQPGGKLIRLQALIFL